MDRKPKSEGIENIRSATGGSSEEIVNDSLGTVDTADSTGLDTDLEDQIDRDTGHAAPRTKSDQADGSV